MSNLPKNYEKILLGVAGLAAVGFAAWGYMTYSGMANDFAFNAKGKGPSDVTIKEAPVATKAMNSLKLPLEIKQDMDGDRPVDFFIGVALFINKNDPTKPVDLWKGDPLFPPIPNRWWLETGANPEYADSPKRDDDGDGFSNQEEFEAHTNPTDKNDFPALINKLAYIQDKSTMWYVKFGYESDGKWAPTFLGLTPDKKALKNKAPDTPLSPGDTFFEKGDFAGRFKFTAMIKKEITSERTHTPQEVSVAQYEDLKANKKGTKYESQQSLPEAEINANAYYDRSAIIELHANGQEGKQIVVEEGTKFALPFDAPEKAYKMKTITPASIEVEFTGKDGTTQTLQFNKGGTH